MNNYKNILLLCLVVMMLPGCASFGPTIRIETPEPAEDFVVLCEWHKAALIDFHGGGMKRSDWKAFVTESSKEMDCGVSFGGGDGSVSVKHPVYWSADISEVDGITVYKYTKTRLDRLDELEHQFKTGYFDKFNWPGSKYANYVRSVCGFPHQYFKYYRESGEEINISLFKKAYDQPMLECLERTYAVLKKYYRGFSKDANARKSMDEKWKRLEIEKQLEMYRKNNE